MTFTHEFMKDNCGCYELDQLISYSFMQSNPVTLESIFKSEIPTKDKFWFYCKKVATKEQNQKIAIDLSEMVLPIYEAKYPDNKAPREAIESAKLFIAGHLSLEDLLIKRRAADAAAADAAADTAADAAADTAAAAAAASYAYAAAAAASYAYAAYAAAAYAADATAAADIKKQIEEYLLNLLPCQPQP